MFDTFHQRSILGFFNHFCFYRGMAEDDDNNLSNYIYKPLAMNFASYCLLVWSTYFQDMTDSNNTSDSGGIYYF